MFEVSFELLRRSTAASVAQEDVLRSSFAIALISTLSLSLRRCIASLRRKSGRTENDYAFKRAERQRDSLFFVVVFFFPKEGKRERESATLVRGNYVRL